MYYAAVEASAELARDQGSYQTYEGSPASKGQLQPDLWGVTPSGRWDWAALREKVAQHGMRNSLLLAPMPTASTAQIMGNNESTEPFTSNMYNRRVLAGEFTVVNKYLLRDLVEKGLWTPEVRNQIIADRGSVQNVGAIPKDVKELYKTVWEIKQKCIIDQAADRGAFICQSQSLNIHMAEPTTARLTSMHFYAWKRGLKTGMYYLRTRPKADAIQFTVDQTALAKTKKVDSTKGEEEPVAVENNENVLANKATAGLDYAAEAACENCSA
jgi:ribonucleotide reductase alpha subunit